MSFGGKMRQTQKKKKREKEETVLLWGFTLHNFEFVNLGANYKRFEIYNIR